MLYACAQSGCQACIEHLLRQHTGLVHWVIRRTWGGDLSYAELLQEGQIALWQAIRCYDPAHGVAFTTYAVTVIRHRLWRLVAQAQRPQGYLPPTPVDDPAELAAAAWQRQAVQAALREALAYLPERAYHIIVAAYGLDGQPPLSLAAIGRLYGLTRERIRQLRNDALVVLRLPACSYHLRRLCDQTDRTAYQQARKLNQAWLSHRRGGG